jgi:hypothetical protein
MTQTPIIQWQYPPPQNALDRFVGPGTTNAEALLQVGGSVLAAAALLVYAQQQQLGWTLPQTLVALLLVLDMVGGVITNAANPAKRWYHRPGQGTRQHLQFVALHLLQPVLLVLFFRAGDSGYVAVVYGYLLAAAVGIVSAPLYLQRPLAMTLWLGGLVLNGYVLVPTAGFEWFLPVFYLKLLVCHLVREEPYRPTLHD